MQKISIIFFGTHQFAATILDGLLQSPFIGVALVITQPDRPVGRKQELQEPPVKILAKKHGLRIDQPATLKNYTIKINDITLCITAQYGLLIPRHILEIPPYGVLNVHTSLLPKYRGASPIQSAVMNGETETGVTIMKMDAGLDTGPVLLQKTMPIAPDDTYPALDQKLAFLGCNALLEAITPYIEGALIPQAQDNSQATTCREFTRDDGNVDWQKTSTEIYNQWRALTPWPGIWTMWQDKRLKLLRVKPDHEQMGAGIFREENKRLLVGCGTGSIEILELQLEGKKPMAAAAFLSGHTI